MFDVKKLPKWELSGLLTPSRTTGAVGFHKNGDFIDVWIRDGGKLHWYAVIKKELEQFLSGADKSIIFSAESDENAGE